MPLIRRAGLPRQSFRKVKPVIYEHLTEGSDPSQPKDRTEEAQSVGETRCEERRERESRCEERRESGCGEGRESGYGLAGWSQWFMHARMLSCSRATQAE